ncbi:family 16 glycosylhydrolase [Arenicella xantha]|uniref:Malectin (Di-glucose binding ER protein) n=1 Tax=Arenicella xantha TaxID=644221 RepID=A0A395JFV7_9GAMM|nr:family 16 glycosylhydrolase [Arenicella xantha]RBP48736.1 malectin (di-glucose binding ER protein) [Arenicella xantha]
MTQRFAIFNLVTFISVFLIFGYQIPTWAAASNYPVAWALNVGGEAYTGEDGIEYRADDTDASKVGNISIVQGAQDQTVLRSYRRGMFTLNQPLENGLYTVTLLFAEPEDLAIGDRRFDVKIQDVLALQNFDIVQARGGNSRAAVIRSVPNVAVKHGVLAVTLESIQGEPVLNGIVVRPAYVAADDWTLVWGDEFDYLGAPDPQKWSYDLWPAGKVNQELQAYTDQTKNVRVENGRLIIQAHKEAVDQPSANQPQYTSGRIHSANKGDILYGRVEVKAKLPAGQGTWPAIWMLPTDAFRYATSCGPKAEWQGSDRCDAWPNSGEIDIMEHVGYDMNRVHGTVHTKAYYWVNGEQRQATVEAESVAQRFHLYALEWSPQRLDIFYDEQLYFTYLNQDEGWQAWPFDHPFHVILNLAVGGNWGAAGGPVDNSVMPATLEVDYVRFYKPKAQEKLNVSEALKAPANVK